MEAGKGLVAVATPISAKDRVVINGGESAHLLPAYNLVRKEEESSQRKGGMLSKRTERTIRN